MSTTLPKRQRTDRTSPSDPIEAAQQFVISHLDEPLTARLLAGMVHLSARHFSRRFRVANGVSPGKWIAQQRLERAAELLQYADLSITAIASEVGFVDLPTFSKAFKRWKQVSPSEYRELYLHSSRTMEPK